MPVAAKRVADADTKDDPAACSAVQGGDDDDLHVGTPTSIATSWSNDGEDVSAAAICGDDVDNDL